MLSNNKKKNPLKLLGFRGLLVDSRFTREAARLNPTGGNGNTKMLRETAGCWPCSSVYQTP